MLWGVFGGTRPALDRQDGPSRDAGARVQVPFIRGRTLLGYPRGPIPLEGEVGCCLTGGATSRAVPSPDGRMVAYETWHEVGAGGIPSIRVVDIATGQDRILAEGATSIAWRSDGTVAHFVAREPTFRPNEPYVGDLVVRSSLDATPEVWTTEPGFYLAIGWAGETLLAYRQYEGEHVDVLALDGPGQVRTLATGALIVAISPDGTEVALVPQGDTSLRPLRGIVIMDVAGGGIAARLQANTIGALGSWSGDEIALFAGEGVGFVRYDGTTLRRARRDVLSRDVMESLLEPVFTDEAGDHLVVVSSNPDGSSLVTCDFTISRCDRGPLSEDEIYVVRNPSRPA